MRFKVGDKVNFLNEQGGGVVKAIIDSKLVKVETNDGFEVPVMITELIRDFRAQPREEELLAVSSPSHTAIIQEEEDEVDRISEINPWGSVREEKGIYYAFEPHEQQWLLTGDMDVFLLNHTSNEILYNIFLVRDSKLRGIDFGSVPPKSKIIIDTISRDDIEDWISGYVQVMFHSDQPRQVFMPLHSSVELKTSRFFKEGSYKENSLLQGKAILLLVTPESALQIATGSEQEQKFGSESKASIAEQVKEKPVIDKHRKAFREAEVDLHIGELVDNILGLSNHDMLNIQVEYFKKTLESAINNDYQKVTFIHGVGNGVLKDTIIEELKNYEDIEDRMASISKFGVGALDVLIKNKE